MGVMVGQPRLESEQRLGYRSLDPVAILRVEDRNGDIIYETQSGGARPPQRRCWCR
jgi:hypothetical protein